MSKSISDKVVRNTANNPTFSAILEANLSRRTVMRGSLGSALAMFAGVSMSACGGGDDDNGLKLGFDSLPTSMTDACVVPAGYVASVLGAWGTPLNDQAAPWSKDGNNSSTDLLHSTGMHHDGMHFFPLNGSSSEGLLVVNHEYIDEKALHRGSAQGDQCPRRGCDAYPQTRRQVGDHQELQIQPPLHLGHADESVRPRGQDGLGENAFLHRWLASARYQQQLRQRHHALGHLHHGRRELGCLLRQHG